MWTQLLPKLHGAATHFPIVLTLAALLFELLAIFLPRIPSLRPTARSLVLLAALSTFPAVASGLFLTKGQTLGHGPLLYHHLFLWPAFAGLLALGFWHALLAEISRRTLYLFSLGAVSALMAGAGYWGGEMLLTASEPVAPTAAQIEQGRQAFAMSCADCHGADAHGDEGPDLHALALSDSRIASTISHGIKGEMPAFGQKYDAPQTAALIAYLRALK